MLPELSHCSHAYAYVVALLHVPLLVTPKVTPCSGFPAIWGATVFAGAGGSTGPTLALVTGVAPPAFDAVTVTLTSFPTSDAFNVYVLAVAPEIAAQLFPELLQSCHAYANVVGLLLQVPLLAVSVTPCCAVIGLIPGAPVTVGAAGSTVLVMLLVAWFAPPAFDPVTITSIVLPTSVDSTVYVLAEAAPLIGAQAVPEVLQASHAYVKVVGLLFQDPLVTLSVSPC